MNKKKKALIRRIGMWLGLLIFLLILIFPFYWIFITSIKDESELYGAVTYWAHNISFAAYKELFTSFNFPKYMWNSVICTFGSICLLQI